MCLHCVGEYEDLFEVMPNIWLSRATHASQNYNIDIGDFALWKNSTNEPLVMFKFEPFADPFENLSDEEIAIRLLDDESEKREDLWWDNFEKFQEALIMEPEVGYDLMMSALVAGFNLNNDTLVSWLLTRIGRMYDEFKRRKETSAQS